MSKALTADVQAVERYDLVLDMDYYTFYGKGATDIFGGSNKGQRCHDMIFAFFAFGGRGIRTDFQDFGALTTDTGCQHLIKDADSFDI